VTQDFHVVEKDGQEDVDMMDAPNSDSYDEDSGDNSGSSDK